MHLLQVEYAISNFDDWKVAFDGLSDLRQQSGVRGYRVLRPTGEPNYVIIELEFDGQSETEAYLSTLERNVYSSREAASSSPIIGTPRTRIVEAVEVKGY
jgi:hypothetical protein